MAGTTRAAPPPAPASSAQGISAPGSAAEALAEYRAAKASAAAQSTPASAPMAKAPAASAPPPTTASSAPAPAPVATKPATSKSAAKGKGKAVEPSHHASGCTSCKQHAHHSTDAHPEHASYVAPDCVLNRGTKMLEAGKTCKCRASKNEAEKKAEVVVHRIFYKRFRNYDLPLYYHEEVLELERTIPAELLRDAMVAPLNAAWPDLDLGSYPLDRPKVGAGAGAARRARTQAVKLEEWPDAECQIEIREELVQLARTLSRDIMFESTAPFVLEELTCLAENHGYNGNLGPPCLCLLAHCLPCLNLLADRLVPKTQPQPASRTPQDYAFLTESAKALRKQGLLPEWKAAGWDEALQAAQRRTADELWRIALEIDVRKVSVDLMTGLKRIGHERFYKLLHKIFSTDYVANSYTYKPMTDTVRIDEAVATISDVARIEFARRTEEAAREKALGNQAFGKGRFRKASSHFTAAMEIDPVLPVYPLNRAAASLKLERFRRAEDDCTRCLNMQPRNSKALFRRAMARKGLGALIDAESDLRLVLALEPKSAAGQVELSKISESLQHVASSSSAKVFPSRVPLPAIRDTAEAQADRRKSEKYWKERFASSLGPPPAIHYGTSGKACRDYNQNPDGCSRGSRCPDSHAIDNRSLRDEGKDRNLCLEHTLSPPLENGKGKKGRGEAVAAAPNDCAYAHPDLDSLDEQTRASLKEIERILARDNPGKSYREALQSLCSGDAASLLGAFKSSPVQFDSATNGSIMSFTLTAQQEKDMLKGPNAAAILDMFKNSLGDIGGLKKRAESMIAALDLKDGADLRWDL